MALLSLLLEQSFRLSCLEYQLANYCQSYLYTVINIDYMSTNMTKFIRLNNLQTIILKIKLTNDI
jgi:hypothetical protein